jgi:hypothetical protein
MSTQTDKKLKILALSLKEKGFNKESDLLVDLVTGPAKGVVDLSKEVVGPLIPGSPSQLNEVSWEAINEYKNRKPIDWNQLLHGEHPDPEWKGWTALQRRTQSPVTPLDKKIVDFQIEEAEEVAEEAVENVEVSEDYPNITPEMVEEWKRVMRPKQSALNPMKKSLKALAKFLSEKGFTKEADRILAIAGPPVNINELRPKKKKKKKKLTSKELEMLKDPDVKICHEQFPDWSVQDCYDLKDSWGKSQRGEEGGLVDVDFDAPQGRKVNPSQKSKWNHNMSQNETLCKGGDEDACKEWDLQCAEQSRTFDEQACRKIREGIEKARKDGGVTVIDSSGKDPIITHNPHGTPEDPKRKGTVGYVSPSSLGPNDPGPQPTDDPPTDESQPTVDSSKAQSVVETHEDAQRSRYLQGLGGTYDEGESTEESSKSDGTGSTKKDLFLRFRSKNKSGVTRLQEALVRAGFELPRFGVDGIFGRETRRAVLAFKKKASSDGKYLGKINGSVDRETLELLESYPEKPSSQAASGPRVTEDSFVLYIGDSQMNMGLGKALMAAGGPGKKIAKHSTNAEWWAEHPRVITYLNKAPHKIIISLNGNGIKGTLNLVKTIMRNNNTTPVTWTGAPPPIRREKSSFNYLNSDSGFMAAYDRRQKYNKTVKDLIPSHWTFIDPYDHIRYEEPHKIGDREFASGYECDKCDGIHLPSAVAEEYVSKIKGFL